MNVTPEQVAEHIKRWRTFTLQAVVANERLYSKTTVAAARLVLAKRGV